jgi:hypothetical protein
MLLIGSSYQTFPERQAYYTTDINICPKRIKIVS